MSLKVKLMGVRIVVRDSSDEFSNLLVIDASEAEALARQLRKAAKDLREVEHYKRELRARGLV